MPCYFPNIAWHNGEKIVVIKKGGLAPPNIESFRLPCGGCLGCRIDYSQTWATRCLHESQMYDENSFVTLTYNDENLPQFPHSLDKKHHQDFIRELRRKISPIKIRYFLAGEYGKPTAENNYIARPHIHILIFGYQFQDLELVSEQEGVNLYTSKNCEEIWQKGAATIGAVTHQSAGYVARYCFKKVNGDRANEHYQKVCPSTGNIQNVLPEYSAQSTNPGIGKPWYDKYKTDVFPSDNIIITGGQAVITPRYYDKLLERDNPSLYEKIKIQRIQNALRQEADSTRARLGTRFTVKKAQLSQLERKL